MLSKLNINNPISKLNVKNDNKKGNKQTYVSPGDSYSVIRFVSNPYKINTQNGTTSCKHAWVYILSFITVICIFIVKVI